MRICPVEVESRECRHGFPVFGETDVHAQLLQMAVDGVVQSDCRIRSPLLQLFVDTRIYFSAAISYLLNKLTPVVLALLGLEDTVKDQLDRLPRRRDMHSSHRYVCPHISLHSVIGIIIFLLRIALLLLFLPLHLHCHLRDYLCPFDQCLVLDVSFVEESGAELVHECEVFEFEADHS